MCHHARLTLFTENRVHLRSRHPYFDLLKVCFRDARARQHCAAKKHRAGNARHQSNNQMDDEKMATLVFRGGLLW